MTRLQYRWKYMDCVSKEKDASRGEVVLLHSYLSPKSQSLRRFNLGSFKDSIASKQAVF